MNDRVGTATPGNEELLAAILREIEASGPITFHRFMELALYHPRLGYYSSGEARVGPRGDFLTSPEVHPAFGALLAAQLYQMWLLMEKPKHFYLMEVGAGRSPLGQDVLARAAHLDREFFASLIHLALDPALASPLDPSRRQPAARAPDRIAARTQSKIQNPKSKIPRLAGSLASILPGAITGCVVANELLDAFPVHVVETREGGLQELYVGWNGHRLVEVFGAVSRPEVQHYLTEAGIELPQGYRAEVNLQIAPWLRQVSAAIRSGYLLVIDYGAPASDLVSAGRPRGTLRCFFRHSIHEDPLVLVGQQDITSHVDLTSLERAAMDVGLHSLGRVTQREFLENLGLATLRREATHRLTSAATAHASRLGIDTLAAPEGLGDLHVLAYAKNARGPLWGFAGEMPHLIQEQLPLEALQPRVAWDDRLRDRMAKLWEEMIR